MITKPNSSFPVPISHSITRTFRRTWVSAAINKIYVAEAWRRPDHFAFPAISRRNLAACQRLNPGLLWTEPSEDIPQRAREIAAVLEKLIYATLIMAAAFFMFGK
jgi:hypothetical protein